MSLRDTAMWGGVYLVARQVASLVIHLTGVLLLTRMIGPKSYGIYASALGIHTYLYIASQSGVNVYLIRREGELTREEHQQVFTLLLLIGVVGATLALMSVPLIQRWIRIENFAPVACTLFSVLPFQLLSLVPSALLERALDYRRVARSELVGQALFYIVALPLAFRGFDEWAPVAGYWTQQLTQLVLLIRAAHYRPRLHWDWRLARRILAYGWAFSSIIWLWQLRELANPLVVGRYAGAEAVGYIALTVRLVDVLSFVKTAAWRLSIAVLARLQSDRERLVGAVSEGVQLQVLTLAPILVSFGILAPWVMRDLFGERWLFVAQIYPFIALSYLTNALFNLHSLALCLVRRTALVVLFSVCHLAVFFGSALILVPRIGAIGYGWSEVAALSTYAVIHAYMVRDVGVPTYGLAGLWWAASVLALFWNQLGWWAVLGPVAALLWPGTTREFRRYAVNFVGLFHAR